MRALVLVLALGCTKADEDAWLLRDATKDIAELEAGLATPKLAAGLGVSRCGHMANLDRLTKLDPVITGKLRKLCTEIYPLGVMSAQVAELEGRRAAKPDVDLTVWCADPFYEHARNTMQQAGTLEAAKAVIARHQALCP